MSIHIYLSSISTICKFEQFILMLSLCYIQSSGKESFGDTRTKSGKSYSDDVLCIVSPGVGNGPSVAAMTAPLFGKSRPRPPTCMNHDEHARA